MRTFFVSISNVRHFRTVYAFNAKVKVHIIGPLNLFDHHAILSRCISRRYCFDLDYETSSRSLDDMDRFSSHLAIVSHNDP